MNKEEILKKANEKMNELVEEQLKIAQNKEYRVPCPDLKPPHPSELETFDQPEFTPWLKPSFEGIKENFATNEN